MIDMEQRLRDHLNERASRVEVRDDLEIILDGVVETARSVGTTHRRRAPIIAAAAAVVAIGVAATAWAVTRPTSSGPADEPPPSNVAPWQPPGTEFPLEDLGVPDFSPWITVAGLSRALGVEGHPPLVIATSLEYWGHETAELQRCLSEGQEPEGRGGGAGCLPEWNTLGFAVSSGSSVDNRVATDDLWTWENVPADAAFVTYVDGAEVRWQRPIAGVVAFPNVEGHDEVATAYTSSGEEVARFDRATHDAAQRRLDEIGELPMADITQDQYEELVTLTESTLRDCLTDRGASLDADNVAVLPAGVDDVQVWNDCVTSVKRVVADRIDAMNIRFFDPTTERPSSPDPAFRFDVTD